MNNITLACCLLLISCQVSALKTEKGSLTVKAVVRNNTCAVAAASQNIVINMGAEATKLFYQSGVEARDNPFDILLENCGPAAKGVTVMLTGTAHSVDRSVFALNNPQAASTAKNIGIALYDIEGKLVEPGNVSSGYPLNGELSNGTGLRFVARYRSTGMPVTAGRAGGSLTFTLTYD
ncbi:fimbrial protein [Aeromonas salmonicida]|uniref:fimbrial protein n=1 Tax=Aeromonas salmonicida TaxID=645 RepID=UPI003D08765B